jgi:ribosomal protein L37AE/L43A
MDCPHCHEPGFFDLALGIHVCLACDETWADPMLPFTPLPDPEWATDDEGADRADP